MCTDRFDSKFFIFLDPIKFDAPKTVYWMLFLGIGKP